MKARALPILLRELEETGDRVRDLKRRGTEIERAGYDQQVSILDGGANVFLEGPHGRERLFLDEDGFRYRSSGQRTTLREVAARVEDDPTMLSPNVLLRPVVESALLPTLSYVAGPGEAAYLPQAEPVFRAHGIGRPVVHPRAALFLMETKISKVMEKFGLALEDLALPHHELAGRLLREEVPPEARRALATLRGAVEAGAEQLGSALRSVDPTLRGPVDSMRTQSLSLLDDVEKKVVHSLKRENDIALAQIAKARAHLFPLGRPQERVLNPFYYLARYDEELTRKVEAAAAGAVLPPPPGER
jgi:uncharacterized protein YllA (UPF0747 family)